MGCRPLVMGKPRGKTIGCRGISPSWSVFDTDHVGKTMSQSSHLRIVDNGFYHLSTIHGGFNISIICILVNQQLAIEHCPFSSLIDLLKVGIFHSYVSLPESTQIWRPIFHFWTQIISRYQVGWISQFWTNPNIIYQVEAHEICISSFFPMFDGKSRVVFVSENRGTYMPWTGSSLSSLFKLIFGGIIYLMFEQTQAVVVGYIYIYHPITSLLLTLNPINELNHMDIN